MSTELSLVATWAPIVISVVSLILTGFFSIRSYRLDKSDKEQNAELRQIQKQLSELQLQKAQEDAAAKTSSKVEACQEGYTHEYAHRDTQADKGEKSSQVGT